MKLKLSLDEYTSKSVGRYTMAIYRVVKNLPYGAILKVNTPAFEDVSDIGRAERLLYDFNLDVKIGNKKWELTKVNPIETDAYIPSDYSVPVRSGW